MQVYLSLVQGIATNVLWNNQCIEVPEAEAITLSSLERKVNRLLSATTNYWKHMVNRNTETVESRAPTYCGTISTRYSRMMQMEIDRSFALETQSRDSHNSAF